MLQTCQGISGFSMRTPCDPRVWEARQGFANDGGRRGTVGGASWEPLNQATPPSHPHAHTFCIRTWDARRKPSKSCQNWLVRSRDE